MKHCPNRFVCGFLPVMTGCIIGIVALMTMLATTAQAVQVQQHTITTTPGANGSIFPAGPILVPDGASFTFFVIASSTYSVEEVKVDGVSKGPITQVKVGPVTADTTITATFIKSPSITATATGSGTISPSGTDTVGYGGDRTFTLQATGVGTALSGLTVNGTAVTFPASTTHLDHTVHNITANTTVKAVFAADPAKVVITSSAGAGGTVLPPGKTAAAKGTSPQFFFFPDFNYHVADVKVDGKSAGLSNPGSYTFTNVQAAHTLAVTFAKNPVITAIQAMGGLISPSGAASVAYDGTKSYTITPSTGYEVASLLINGRSAAAATSYTFTHVKTSGTISATFRPLDTYAFITATAGAGGGVSPSGKTGVLKGGSQTIFITPSFGYRVLDVKVDGKSAGAETSHSFTDVQANHTLAATFAKLPVITAIQAANGFITPSGGTIVAYNGSQNYTISAGLGYEVSSLVVDGKPKPPATSYSFTSVVGNHTISAAFKQRADYVAVTATAGVGGTITPHGKVLALIGSSPSFTISPGSGYRILDVKVGTTSKGAVSSVSIPSIQAATTVSATFAKLPTITAKQAVGGTISPSGAVPVGLGGSLTCTITPLSTHKLTSLIIDGKAVADTDGSYTFTNVTASHTISATFAKLPSIAAKQAAGGSISPAGTKVVAAGGSQTYHINPASGYKIASLLIDGKVVADTDGTYDFINVTASHSISAKFVPTALQLTASAPSGGTISPSGTLQVAYGKDQAFTIVPPAGLKAAIQVDGVIRAQKPDGGQLAYTLKNITKDHTVEALFAQVGQQFAGSLSVAPVGLGDSIKVANKSPALFHLLTSGSLGVAGVYYQNITAGKSGQALAGATESDWTTGVPLVPGDNDIWFAAVGTGGQVSWYPTIVTYYPGSDFTTPLTPYVSNKPLSTLVVGQATSVTWKVGLRNPAGAVVTLYQVAQDNTLTTVGTLSDSGSLPDEIEGDGLFTGSFTITANNAGFLYYRVGVAKPGAAIYYSETHEVWAPPVLTDAKVNTAGTIADNAEIAYDARITAGDTPQEAAQFVVNQLLQDPNIGTAGSTDDGTVWWVTADGILGFNHPDVAGAKGGEGGGPPVAERGQPPAAPTPGQALQPAPTPFYSPADFATLFPDYATARVADAAQENRIKSDRGVIISPFILNLQRQQSSFKLADDYFKPWPTIQAHKTCGLYAAAEFVNNASYGVTLDTFKNLSTYGYIHISTHGDNLYNGLLSTWNDVWGPDDFLKGNLSLVVVNSGIYLSKDINGKYVLGAYADDLNQKRLAISATGALYMLPKFFQDYLGPLPNSLVILSLCRSGFNGSLMNVLRAKGAATAIGFTDYVQTSYAQNVFQEVVDRMYEDKTVLAALQSAVSKYGGQDGSTPPAKLVYLGADDLKFPNGTLTNGGFENGSIAPWEASGDGRVITGLGAERPKEGSFMGIISTGLGYTTSSGSIQQRMCIPDNGGLLSFRWDMYSEEWLEYVGSQYQDTFQVSVAVVDPTSGTPGAFTPLFAQTIDSLAGSVSGADVGFDRGGVYKTGWRLENLDLTPYAGKTIILRFYCYDVGDSIYDTAVLLDDIKFIPTTGS